MKLNYARRTAAVIAILMGALAPVAAAGPFAGIASAATSTISYNSYNGTFSGSGFTPGGQVRVQEQVGTTLVGSTTVTASLKVIHCYRYPEEPPDCVTINPGGLISGTLSPNPGNTLGCAVTLTGTVSATDLATGNVVSEPVTWMGLC
jgi:hypothetical protein